jgi:hypothetical protein
MSRSGRIELDFLGEVRDFRLAIGELEALQEEVGVGPMILLARLVSGVEYSLREVLAILKHGLIGGGGRPSDVRELLSDPDSKPLRDMIVTSGLALGAALEQPDDEPIKVKHKKAVEEDFEEDERGLFKFEYYYGTGAAIGFSPDQVKAMSLWQFMAACEGVRKSRDPNSDGELTPQEEMGLREMLAESPNRMH